MNDFSIMTHKDGTTTIFKDGVQLTHVRSVAVKIEVHVRTVTLEMDADSVRFKGEAELKVESDDEN